MKRELEQLEIPGEDGARARSWQVVAAAFTERSPMPRPSHWPRVAVVALALSALVAAAVSAPGRAVLEEVREVVGVERAQPALFSLPASGTLLVASDAGVWVVQEDGSRRLLGEYREASWSPFGRFVVATRANELAALEPDGDVRWTLPRPGVTSPSWTGTETDTRIVYIDRTGVRIVAGDGTGDRLLLRGAKGIVAVQPAPGRLLAVVSARATRVLEPASGRTIWRARAAAPPTTVSWSGDGRRLLVSSARSVQVFDAGGNVLLDLGSGAAPIRAAALAPKGRSVAYVMETAGQSQLWVVPRIGPDANAARRLFAGAGELRELTWSPNGRWLLVGWVDPDQWLAVRADGRGIRAVSNIAEQFRSASFPRIEGWCCALT